MKPDRDSVGMQRLSAATGVNNGQLGAGRRFDGSVQFDSRQPSQFSPCGVMALAHIRTVEQDQRKTLISVLLQCILNDWAGGKRLGLLRQVVPLDSDSLVCQPMQIRGESNERRVYGWATHPRRATHRGIEYFHSLHDSSFRI